MTASRQATRSAIRAAARPFPEELAGRLGKRFGELDEATEALLNTARVSHRFVRDGGLEVSLLPRDNFPAADWQAIGGAVETAMISQKNLLKKKP